MFLSKTYKVTVADVLIPAAVDVKVFHRVFKSNIKTCYKPLLIQCM